jgi:hypothetical protein
MNLTVSSFFDASISPELERNRLQALHSLVSMDTPADEMYNDITR